MKHRTLAMVAFLAAAGTGFHLPASAQTAVGGPTRQAVVGGPTRQNSPVLPPNKGGSVPVRPPPSAVKCSAGACAAADMHR